MNKPIFRGKKRILAGALERSGVFWLLRKFKPRGLHVLNYHRIRSLGAARTEFDEDILGPTVEEFRSQMRWLSENYSLLSEDDLMDAVYRDRPIPGRAAMVTFDDGYLDCFSLALTVLREFRIPAIFFIPTAMIIKRELGWWDQIAYLVKRTRQSELRIGADLFKVDGDRTPLIRLFQDRMRSTPHEKTADFIARLSVACDVLLPDRETSSRELMNFDQIREASSSGISVGSHTHSHRVLSTIGPQEQTEELLISKSILEKELGHTIRSISYPVGGYQHVAPQTPEIARDCGYRLGFSFHTGLNSRTGVNPFDIRRIATSSPLSLFRAALSFPTVFAPTAWSRH